MNINPDCDGVVMLSPDIVFFNEAESRPDGRRIYHVFEKVLDDELFDDEKLNSSWDKDLNDKKDVLFSKATQNNLQNIQEVLENNGIPYDEWCPPITPIVHLSQDPSVLNCEKMENSNLNIASKEILEEKEDSPVNKKNEMFIEVGIFNDENSNDSTSTTSSVISSQSISGGWNNSNKSEVYRDIQDKWFFCPSCSYVTHCEESFKVHQQNHKKVRLICNHCNYETYKKSAFKLHQLRHIEDKLYGCVDCDFTSNYKHNLKTHLRSKHNIDASNFTDDVLKQLNYVRNADILNVLENNKNSNDAVSPVITNERLLYCSSCDFNTKLRKEIKKHVMTHFPNDYVKDTTSGFGKKFKCSECDFRTKSKSKIRKHVILHCGSEKDGKVASIGNFYCPKCEFFTPCDKLIIKHMNFHMNLEEGLFENIDGYIKCPHCEYVTEVIEYMQKHMKEHKCERVKVYKCSKCDFQTSRYRKYQKHKDYHLEIFSCRFCSYSSKVLFNLRRHELIHLKPRPYKCSFCDEDFSVKARLTIHISNCHDPNRFDSQGSNHSSEDNFDETIGSKILNCPTCDYTCASKFRMDKHVKLHSEAKIRECSYCMFTTTSDLELQEHELNHIIKKLYQCSTCEYNTKIKRELEEHELVHLDENLESYECSRCSFSVSSISEFKKHSLDHIYSKCKSINSYEKRKLYSCSKCNYTTKIKQSMKQHKLTHLDVKIFKCTMCDYTSNYKGNMKMHELNHMSIKKFNCEKCNYATNIRIYLELHNICHLDPGNLKCYRCDFVASQKTALRKHMVSDHSTSKTKLRSPKNSDSNILYCTDCPYTTFSRSALYQHKLSHSLDKKFKCSECNYSTNFRGNLNHHEQKHKIIDI